jgi:AcrR family transcriptional regulator
MSSTLGRRLLREPRLARPVYGSLDWPDNGAVPSPSTAPRPTRRTEGSTQRQHILSVALSLMAQNGVDGTSMRDLAGATGLNVASLYHYFPSKRELLVAILQEHGFVDDLVAAAPPTLARDEATGLADLLEDILVSMLEVEDFIRLMLGEVLRGDETAHAVGIDLFQATQVSLERWLVEHRPDLCAPEERVAMARMLRAMLVGMFVEHVAGVLVDDGADPAEVFRQRARESAELVERYRPPT